MGAQQLFEKSLPPVARSTAPGWKIVVARDAVALEAIVPAWEELAAHALEHNPFYEPWMLLPALESFGRESNLQFVLVYDDQPAVPLLCGLFPLERPPHYRGLPVRYARLWQHLHCYLGTPLLRRGQAEACLAALLDWISAAGTSAIEWRKVAAEGPFITALGAVREQRRTFSFRSYHQERALLRRSAGGSEAYLQRALPKASRKEFRRLQARLAECGEIGWRVLESSADAPRWIEDFLQLEMAGWKGTSGSALGCSEAGRSFFRRAALGAAARGRLMMLALSVNGLPVAMKCNFLAGEGSFAFKIAYDESFARYSPGTLLELENIRAFHRRPDLQWMDSCADPDHFMANRLWQERRPLANVMAATGKAAGNFVVPSLSLLHRLRSGLRGGAAAGS